MAVAENKVGEMLREALDRSDIAVKALAQDSHYSEDAFYSAMQGKRKIPREAKRNIAAIHPLGGLAVAYQETGYGCFLVIDGDPHPQNLLQRAFKEDAEADQALEGMGWKLIDKQSPEDLTDDDVLAINLAAKEIIDEIRSKFSLLVAWEDNFKIQLVKMFLEAISEKERATLKAAR